MTDGVGAELPDPGDASARPRRDVDVAPALRPEPTVRGLLLVGAVAFHVEVAGGWEGPVSRLVAATVGVEGFVLVSGLALGLAHSASVQRTLSAVVVHWRRAAGV